MVTDKVFNKSQPDIFYARLYSLAKELDEFNN